MAAGVEIEFCELTFAFDRNASPALNGISLRLGPGTCTAILGATGSGKTSLLFAIAGILGQQGHAAVASGSLAIDGQVHTPLPTQVQFPAVGMLMQEPHLQLSGMTERVDEEIAWTLANLGTPTEEAARRVHAILGSLDIPHLHGRLIRSLSGGELHRVAMASVLVAEPSVLLLDEPVSSLDHLAREAVLRNLRSFNGMRTVVFTDTEADLAVRVADSIVVLNEGRVEFSGTTSAFLRRLSEFIDVLPTAEWMSARDALLGLPSSSPLRRRLRSFVEGQ